MYADEYAQLVERQVGDLYRLGAEASPSDPDPDVFDCSELVEWSYARAGVVIPDGAGNQYGATYSVPGDPRIGDLCFLKNNPDRPYGIGHVGIITGVVYQGGKLLDATVTEARGSEYGVVQRTLSQWKRIGSYAGLRRHTGFSSLVQERPARKFDLLLEHAESPAKSRQIIDFAHSIGCAVSSRPWPMVNGDVEAELVRLIGQIRG